MRELKFRAWNGQKMLTMQELFALPKYVWSIALVKPTARPNLDIMQYINRNDINGNDIYEGDIIKTYQNHGSDGIFGPYIEEVKWSEEHSGYIPFCLPFSYINTKIISNIYMI